MEFHEKLQALRKQKGLTQEEAAQSLFVSRAAVSKWEQGRGYPNIDSLKAIARFYGVTVDELLSGEELLTIAQEDCRTRFRDRLFGLLDCGALLFFILPIFGDRAGEIVRSVSLLALNGAPWLKGFVLVMTAFGVWTIAAGNRRSLWDLLLDSLGVLLFAVSLQPYGAAVLLFVLMIKAVFLIQKP